PASARDAANRRLLASERTHLLARRDKLRRDLDNHILGRWHPTNEDRALEIVEAKLASLDGIEEVLARSERDGQPRQLLLLDNSGEQTLAALAVGDVDTADHVAVQVSGTGTEVWDKPGVGNDAP